MSLTSHNKATKTGSQEAVVIGFAGDSGDGIQVMGQQFTNASALLGNDVQTFPDFPAEIRAPQGTLAGVSGFQLMFAARDIHTPGDMFDTLVAMNPAAMMKSLSRLKPGGLLILDQDKWTDRDLKKAGLEHDPLVDPKLEKYRIVKVPMTTLVFEAVQGTNLSRAQQRKCKNLFALGLVYWLYERSLEPTLRWIQTKFKLQPDLLEGNTQALKAGYDFAENTELLPESIQVAPAQLPKGLYRQLTGNEALCLGAMMAQHQHQRPLFVAGYPITPASDILHWFAHSGSVKTFQAEDEMAAAGAALGAAFGGSLALTATSGPGMDLKSEMLGLAFTAELPLVLVDVQRAGPSTGMPTKVEQSDLMMALYGRHGECPLPVLAPSTPADCYKVMIEAFEWAVKAMMPVIVLSDAYLANGAEPWKIPSEQDYPKPYQTHKPELENFQPYARNEHLTRPWVTPGTAGFEHRLGGLEKTKETGHISYDPENHQAMVQLRAQKIKHLALSIPPTQVLGAQSGELLIVGWGSTWGVLLSAFEALNESHPSIGFVHLRHLNPLPLDLGDLLKRFKKVVVVEMNSGQLVQRLRADYLVDAQSLTKIKGQPFTIEEVQQGLEHYLGLNDHATR